MQSELKDLASRLPREAGPAVEDKLLQAFRQQKRRRAMRWRIAVAATLVIGCAAGYFATVNTHHPPKRAVAASPTMEFVALPYSQSGVPLENPVIVHMTLGRSELGALGVSAAVVNAREIGGTEKIHADLLVGQDGVARAVRFVQ